MASWEVEAEGYDMSFSPSCDALVVHHFKQGTFIGLTGSTLEIRHLQWQIDGRGALAVAAVNRSEVWAAGYSELKQFVIGRGTSRSFPSSDRSHGHPWDPPLLASHDGRLLALVTDVYGRMNASPATVHTCWSAKPANRVRGSRGTAIRSTGWLSAPTAVFSPPEAATRRCECGRVPPACGPNGHRVGRAQRADAITPRAWLGHFQPI